MGKKFPPTPQQQDFLDAIANERGHLALKARAGCGKTSTIMLAAEAIVQDRRNPRSETLVCAFNKAIALEVDAKLKRQAVEDNLPALGDFKRIQASTLHSLGFLLSSAFPSSALLVGLRGTDHGREASSKPRSPQEQARYRAADQGDPAAADRDTFAWQEGRSQPRP